jgi:hypothetical protein
MPNEGTSNRRIASKSTNVRLTYLVYLALAVAVAAPLLGTGLVLAVDLSQTPHPGIPAAYWGIPEGTHVGPPARLPLDAAFAALGGIDAVWVGQKLMLLAIVFLAGFGLHRLVPVRTERARLFAGFLYAVNPFVYDRLYTGQWFLLLGYALLPHAYLAFLRALDGRRLAPFAFGALFLATGIASTHMAVLLLVLCGITLLAQLRKIRQRPRGARGALAAFALAMLPSLYWLVPTPGVEDLWRNIGSGQLDLYRTVADHDWGLAPTVAGLYGYWNNVEPIKSHLSAWPLLALTLVMLAAWGGILRRRDPTTLAVAAAGAFGFLLALGDSSFLTRDTYTWALDHFSFLRSFREPQKGVALLVLAYAFLGAIAVDDLLRNPPRRRAAAHLVSALVLALPLLYGYRMFGGLWGELHTSRFPASWEEADQRLSGEAAHSRTLFLPWHGYFAVDFAHGRVVSNPAPSFFGTPVLASRSVGEGSGIADTSDPAERQVNRLLAQHPAYFASCLAQLGVSHVLLAKVADWEQYRFLDGRRDIVPEQRWRDLVLYRLRAPGGLVMKRNSATARGCAKVRPLAISKQSPVRYTIDEPGSASSQVALGLPQAGDWKLRKGEVAFEPWASYRRNYLLGLAGLAAFLGILFQVLRRRN